MLACRAPRHNPPLRTRPFPAPRPLPSPQEGASPVLTMCTTLDAADTSVLMVSHVGDRAVRLLELPSFEGRGSLQNVSQRARRCACAS